VLKNSFKPIAQTNREHNWNKLKLAKNQKSD